MLKCTRRTMHALEAVVDIAFHARPEPVQSKDIAARQGVPQRYLEQVMQHLVRNGILKGVRGPRGGYELARERRRITVADIVRAASSPAVAVEGGKPGDEDGAEPSALVRDVVMPAIDQASEIFLEKLQEITVDDLCQDAQTRRVFGEAAPTHDFSI